MGIGDWGLGIGDWGLGKWVIGPVADYLKRSSNALRALFVVASPPLLVGDEVEGAVLVWRSTVVRGVIRLQLLRRSLGEIRAGILAFTSHSQRTLVSKFTH